MSMCKDPGKPRILFADDDPDMLEALVIAAQHHGWCAVGVTSGEALLETVNKACEEGGPCFDIIVTDIQFFSGGHDIKMTGLAAAREVRDKFQNLPILFLTGYAGPLTREDAKTIGQTDILDKPVALSTLMARIQRLMRWTKGYEGVERRMSSVNRSGLCRRRTDKRLQVPAVLEKAMRSAREG